MGTTNLLNPPPASHPATRTVPYRQVYVLSLDTLQWSTLDPNPLGFSGPAIYGHTAVEDPAHPGRLIVFGGRGGNHWNTEVWTDSGCYLSPPGFTMHVKRL